MKRKHEMHFWELWGKERKKQKIKYKLIFQKKKKTTQKDKKNDRKILDDNFYIR
jgi:hypothetical protein